MVYNVYKEVIKMPKKKYGYYEDHRNDVVMRPIISDDLVCKDCLLRFEDPLQVGECERFDLKPRDVLRGGKCGEFIKKR